MHHDTPLITTIVAGLVLAYIFGMIAHRLKMPPLVGYLFAGILAGPYTPGFVADQALGAELAELGVILLMFGVGLHFSLKDLMSVRALAIPGALAQIALATLLGLGLATLLGWGLGAGLIFGLALSVASTVVLLKAMQDRRLIETERGRIAVGWLIVEDLAMVLALVLIPAIASASGGDTGVHDPFVSFVARFLGVEVGIWGILALTLIKVAAFVGFMLVVGRRVIPWALHGTAHTGSRELFRLAVLAIALGVALGSALLFGVSLALGAFFAGMILSESELSHRAAQETLPLRDAFAVLFFVSVGMLFDPSIIITDPLPVLATVFIIVIGKSVAALGIVLLAKRPLATALTISASLAQIGEFSFILASMGVALAILPAEGQDLILAGALISIVLNPVVFWAVDLAKPRIEARVAQRKAARAGTDGVQIDPPMTKDEGAAIAADVRQSVTETDGESDDQPEASQQTGHTVLVGFGRVGRVVGEGLRTAGAPLVVVEDTEHSVASARAAGIEVVFGNAASVDVLKLANLQAASCLLIASPNGFEAGTVCEVGRKLNPSIRIIARAHSDEEAAHLRSLGADTVIMGEREIGLGMLSWLRGERSDGAAAAGQASEAKLPAGENVVSKAAANAALVETVKTDGDAIVAVADPAPAQTLNIDEQVAEEISEGGPIAPAPRVDTVETVKTDGDQVVVVSDAAADQTLSVAGQVVEQVSEGGPIAPAATAGMVETIKTDGDDVVVVSDAAPDEMLTVAEQVAEEISEGGPVISPSVLETFKSDGNEMVVVSDPAPKEILTVAEQVAEEISEGGPVAVKPEAVSSDQQDLSPAEKAGDGPHAVPPVTPEPKG
jgi:monovalent cation:H+ antiporter-2, CPA2 family